MDQEELFRRLAVALAIGLLIGLERGWQTREESDHQRTAGLRTFALTGLLGGICGLMSVVSSPIVLAAGLLAFTGALTTFSYLEANAEKNFSVTGVVAGILTFVLGAYATLGNETVAVAAAVAMAILLALREPLHSWVRNVTWPEMRSVLVLLAMSFLLLPILPNRPVDPWNVLNPSEIWLLAILIAAVSFAGYIAVRVLGDRKGIAVAAIAGGMASSTATTLSFARLAREHPESTHLLAGGVLLAGVTMLVRIVVLAGLLKPELIPALLWPAAAADRAAAGCSGRVVGEARRRHRIPATADQEPVRSWHRTEAGGPHRGHPAGGQNHCQSGQRRRPLSACGRLRCCRCRRSDPLYVTLCRGRGGFERSQCCHPDSGWCQHRLKSGHVGCRRRSASGASGRRSERCSIGPRGHYGDHHALGPSAACSHANSGTLLAWARA